MPKELDSDERSILLGQLKMINERIKVVGSDKDRLEMLQVIQHEICPNCGRLNAEGHTCCCVDDEDYE